jgi:phosphate transport system substrate-binding protein
MITIMEKKKKKKKKNYALIVFIVFTVFMFMYQCDINNNLDDGVDGVEVTNNKQNSEFGRRLLLRRRRRSLLQSTTTTTTTIGTVYTEMNPLRLFGAGATFPANAYKSSMRAYKVINKEVSVSYLDVGSGKGICRILNSTELCTDDEEPLEVDFACSDSLLVDANYLSYPDVQMYPVVAGAVTPVYNLPTIGSYELLLTKETISLIYSGTITKWNDSRIKSANPSVALLLPFEDVLVGVRKDSSGTTEAWTKALSEFSETFKNSIGASKLPSWEPYINSTLLNEVDSGYGLASFVKGRPYSIGYVVLSDAMNLKLSTIGLLDTDTSTPVYPNSASITAAILQRGLQFGNNGDDSSRLTADLMGADNAGAWPIATYSYLILRKGMNPTTNTAIDRIRAGATCDNMRETLNYWTWFLTSPLTKTIMEYNSLVQVPAVVRNFVVARMQGDLYCGGERLASIFDTEPILNDNLTKVVVHTPSEEISVLDSLGILLTASNSSMQLEIARLGGANEMFNALDENRASVLALNYAKDETSSLADLVIFDNAETPIYPTPLPEDFPNYISFPFIKISLELAVNPSVLRLGETNTSIQFDIYSAAAILSGKATTWGDAEIIKLNPWLTGVTEPIILVGLEDLTIFKTFETLKRTISSFVPDFSFASVLSKSASSLSEVGALVVASDYSTALLQKTAYVPRNSNLVLLYSITGLDAVRVSVTLRRSYTGDQCVRETGAYDSLYAQLRFWEWVYSEDDIPGMISSVTAEPDFNSVNSVQILSALRSIKCNGEFVLVAAPILTSSASEQSVIIVVTTTFLFVLLFVFIWVFRFRDDSAFTKRFFERYKKKNLPPSEACTIVVTDIQSSTNLWEIAPVTMNKALAAHDLIIRQEMQKFYGYEVLSEGDSFTMAFHTPGDALKACANIQSRLQEKVWDRSLFLASRHVYRTDDAELQSTQILRPQTVPPFLEAILQESSRSIVPKDTIIKVPTSEKDAQNDSSTDPSGRVEEEEEIINGLRVRMGIHTGSTHRYVHPTTRRQVYEGKAVELARKMCHAANGGQILMSGDVLASFGTDSLQISQILQLMHMGKHQMDMGNLNRFSETEVLDNAVAAATKATDDDFIFNAFESESSSDGSSDYEEYRAATSAKIQALQRMVTSYDPKIVSHEVIQAIPKKLVERIKLFAPIKTVRQLEPSIFEAPVFTSENLTVVFTKVEGWEELGKVDMQMRDRAVAQHDSVIRSTLLSFRGYECRGDNGRFFIAFHHPNDAFRWCLVVQTILLRVPWEDELLQQPQACNMTAGHRVTFKGLRVTMGIVSGSATYMKPCQRTGRAEYFGQVLNLSARVGGLAQGGQILCDKDTWRKAARVGFPYEHSRYIGLYSLRGIMEPVGLVQVSDASLNMRSFSSVIGAQKVIDPSDKFRLSARDIETERIDRPLSFIGDIERERASANSPGLPFSSIDRPDSKLERESSKTSSPRLSFITGADYTGRFSDESSNGGSIAVNPVHKKRNILIVSSSDNALFRMTALVNIVAGGKEFVFISRSKSSNEVLKKFSVDLITQNEDGDQVRDAIPSIVIIVGTIESGSHLRDLVQKIRRGVPFMFQPKIAVMLTDESSVIDGVTSSPVEYGADVELPPLLFADEDQEIAPLVDKLGLVFDESASVEAADGTMRSSSRSGNTTFRQQSKSPALSKDEDFFKSSAGSSMNTSLITNNNNNDIKNVFMENDEYNENEQQQQQQQQMINNNNNVIINPLSNLLRDAENQSKILSNFASANLMVAGLEATGLAIFAVDTDARIILCTKKGFAKGIVGSMIFPNSSFSKRLRDSAKVAERMNPPPPWVEKLTKNWIPLEEDESYIATTTNTTTTTTTTDDDSNNSNNISNNINNTSASENKKKKSASSSEIITVRCTPLRISDDFGGVMVLIKEF